MNRGDAVSYRQLQSAYADVQRELARAGLWYEGHPLTKTEVIWCHFAPPDLRDAKGFFINETHRLYRAFGCEAGHIYVPRRVLEQGPRRYRGSLRDVLRHEFGHALAYYHPALIRRSRAFVEAFGACYDGNWPDPPTDSVDFVTDYAMTSPMEDFAETFARWLCNPDNPLRTLPRFRRNPHCRPTRALRAKLRFVRDVCRRLVKD